MAHDGTIHLWSSRKDTCLRHSSSSPCDQRFIGRERGIGCVPVSMRSSNPRAAVRRQTRRRVRKYVGVLASQRYEVRGISVVDRQRERRPVGSEGDAADEKLRAQRAVGERRAGIGKAGQRVLGPYGRGRRGEHGLRGRSGGAPPGGAPKSRAAERRDPTEAARPTVLRSARASAGERRLADEAATSRVRSTRTRWPDVQPRSAQRQTSSES